MVLCYEMLKDRASRFWPYLNVLPVSFDLLELWGESEIKELQDGSREQEVVTERLFRKANLEELRTILVRHHLRNISKEIVFPLYLWARAVVSTRCFELNLTMQHVLVPFADLLNHHIESPTTWTERSGFFVMHTKGGGFERGTQVYNNYGGDQT